MPIYEYECTKCGHQTEVWQKMAESPLTRCEHCNGKMRKLISQSSFHLKGTGWYVTDYASKRSSDNGKSERAGEDKASTIKESRDGDKAVESKAVESKAGESKAGESKSTSSKPKKHSSSSPKKE